MELYQQQQQYLLVNELENDTFKLRKAEEDVVMECKKNKTTKQAEKKRKKRKTGSQLSIRNK